MKKQKNKDTENSDIVDTLTSGIWVEFYYQSIGYNTYIFNND